MTVYRIKLTDFEMRVLINILNEHRLRLKQDGKSINEIDDLLLKVLNVYEKYSFGVAVRGDRTAVDGDRAAGADAVQKAFEKLPV